MKVVGSFSKINFTLIFYAVIILFLINGCGEKKQPPQALLEPDEAELNSPAPDVFKVKFETTKGDFVIEVHRDWSPIGVDRFYYLVKNGYYDDARFFRVIKKFVAQFGINGFPEVSQKWTKMMIPDDPVKQSNLRGYISYAKSAMPNSRSTQLFINYGDNSNLDALGFSPFGKVIEGMEVVDKLYAGYGDDGPAQHRIIAEGNDYLKKDYPELDYIKKASLIASSAE